QLLEAENLHSHLGRAGNQAFVLGNHFFLDVRQRILFRGPFTLSLNQTAANDTGHATPPEQTQAKSLLCARLPDKVAARQCAISPLPTNGGNEYRSLIDPGPNIDGTSLVPDQRCDSRSLRSEQRSEEHTSELQSLRHLVC